VVSANLWHGRADADGFADLIVSLAPDVVAVQELSPEQADALARVMPWGLLAPSRHFSGMGIALSRPGVVRRLRLPCRDAHVAELPAEQGDGLDALEVLNVHLIAPHLPPVWRTLSARRAQLRGVLAHLDASPGRRRVVAGDLNATPVWPAYRRLAARLRDAALEVARRRGGRPQPTWGLGSDARRLLRLDHVLVAGLDVRDVRVVPIQGSDHHAVVADVTVPEGRSAPAAGRDRG